MRAAKGNKVLPLFSYVWVILQRRSKQYWWSTGCGVGPVEEATFPSCRFRQAGWVPVEVCVSWIKSWKQNAGFCLFSQQAFLLLKHSLQMFSHWKCFSVYWAVSETEATNFTGDQNNQSRTLLKGHDVRIICTGAQILWTWLQTRFSGKTSGWNRRRLWWFIFCLSHL